MNATFKTKFLLHLNQKKNASGEQGFTLIELLVVIIIIGILAAIALPSFLNQANKGKQAEAKQYVSSVNKAQQAYYTEKGNFITLNTADAWGSLAVGINTQTSNYKYSLSGFVDGANALAGPLSTALKAYVGVTGLVAPSANSDKTSQAVVCESDKAGAVPGTGSIAGTVVKCPASFTGI